MSNKGVGIAFKITVLVLLLGTLGIGIGILIVDLNIRDDVEAPVPTVPACTQAPIEEPDTKNIASGRIIERGDSRFAAFQGISDLYEKWMNVSIDPCDDFYHYVCGAGQNSGQKSPFTISQNKDDAVVTKMWKANDAYFAASPLPVKQIKWVLDRCSKDDSYTEDDQAAKIKERLNQYLAYTDATVPFFQPTAPTNYKLDKNTLSKLAGYAKGQFGAYPFLTSFVSTDFKAPDTAPYVWYVDQPLAIFRASLYQTGVYQIMKPKLIDAVVQSISDVADLLEIDISTAVVTKMAGDVVEMDKQIATTMQQDPIVRRQVERNYNPYTLAELNEKADQFDWVQYIQSAMSLLGNQVTATELWKVIIMEEDITLNKLNSLIKTTNAATVANYVFFVALDQIMGSVPAPPQTIRKTNPMAEYRAVFKREKKTLAGMLRKPVPSRADQTINTFYCEQILDNIMPWAATRMYVDTDIPDKNDRATLKKNVAEIANWIFFGFRSQLDQLNWMDAESKKGAFNKLDNIQLNVAFPDWVADDAALSAFYQDLTITVNDNFMNQYLKLSEFYNRQEVLPLLTEAPRDRSNFDSFIGITNAWYQPQYNSITFPEGILQEPFYSPNYPLATIFGGLGAISGHELTHGFDDQGVQWDGIGALNAWMSPNSQASFNTMAQCVIDEYAGFCPYPGVCLNGQNTQGENIADNGGIQAAYKALKAFESLNGADPRLPGFGSIFTSDQLFFLTFAQTWCDKDQDESDFISQIATDVHSPAIYRVLGTIQNFPAFKNAFNCPSNTPYTPDKHCDVWTSKPF